MTRSLATMFAVCAVLVVGGPAAANGPPEVILAQDAFVDVNPCTGEPATVMLDIVILSHAFDNEAGNRHHMNSIGFVDVTTDDGFSGRQVGVDIDNGKGLSGEEEGTGMLQSVVNANLSNGEGQRILVHFTLHLNQVDGVVIAFAADFSARCAGKPA
jgi:hypothetical protein